MLTRLLAAPALAHPSAAPSLPASARLPSLSWSSASNAASEAAAAQAAAGRTGSLADWLNADLPAPREWFHESQNVHTQPLPARSAPAASSAALARPVIRAVAVAGAHAYLGPLTVASVALSDAASAALRDHGLYAVAGAGSRPGHSENLIVPERRAAALTLVHEVASSVRVHHVTAHELNALQLGKAAQSMTDIIASACGALLAAGAGDDAAVPLHLPPRGRAVEAAERFARRAAAAGGPAVDAQLANVSAERRSVAMHAAKLVALAARDAHLQEMADFYRHQTGSGYPHDWETRIYLASLWRKPRADHPLLVRYALLQSKAQRAWMADYRHLELRRHEVQREQYYKRFPALRSFAAAGLSPPAAQAAEQTS